MGLVEDALNGSCQHKIKIIKYIKGNCTWWRHFYNRRKWCLLKKRIEKEDCVHRIFQNPFKLSEDVIQRF